MSQRISVNQVKYVVLISMVLGLIFTLLQIFVDLNQEREAKYGNFSRLIEQSRDTATQASYQLNPLLAERVIDGLMKNPALLHAEIRDDFDDILATQSRIGAETNWLTTQLARYLFADKTRFSQPLTAGPNLMITGQIMITVDATFIARDFLSRAAYSLLFGFVRNLLLAAILMLFFYHKLSRPVRHLTDWVQNLGNGSQVGPIPYQADDELGSLARTFTRLWQDNEQSSKALKQTVAELSRSEKFSRTLLDSAGDALLLCTLDGKIVQVNQQTCRSLGYQPEQLLDQHASLIGPQYTADSLRTLFAENSNDIATLEVSHQRQNGSQFPVEVRGQRTQPGDEPLVLMLARDISARREAEQRIHELAYYDTLTRLPNRRLLQDRLIHALSEARHQQHFGALLYLDLDRFKTINDSLGHNVGDGLLRQVAQRLEDLLHEPETAARIGGDEFVILLPRLDADEEHSADLVAHKVEQIIQQLALPYDVDEHKLYCTSSIGIVLFPHTDSDANELMRRADTALYRVKASGRNDFQFFEPAMQAAAENRLFIEKDLHQALEKNELELYFQPQVNRDGELIGAESLLRWQHPERGLISPFHFLPIAEETGQILAIGDWVIDEALNKLSEWLKLGLPASFDRLAINVSPQQFLQSDFVPDIIERLHNAGVDGRYLEVEVTENMLLDNVRMADEKMQLLKAQGIQISIDDFGTGYSSLSYLKFLTVDVLKIDRSFVTNLHEEASNIAIVDTIIVMAEKLGLEVIAEGVEEPEELAVLRQLGCMRYQGYLFDRPMDAQHFTERLQHSAYQDIISPQPTEPSVA